MTLEVWTCLVQTTITKTSRTTAQRIILELKDKIKTEEAISAREEQDSSMDDEEKEDVIQALQVLGYRRYEINKVLAKVKSSTLEDKIKEALQYLAK